MWADGGRYDAWARFLECWGKGEHLDSSALPRLVIEDFTPDSWERLSNRVLDALGQRLMLWADALTTAIDEARDEFGVARALAQARSGLRTVRALAAHTGLPPDLSQQFLKVVDTNVHSAQHMLEKQVESMRRAGHDRSQVEARLRTLRDNPLTVVTMETDPLIAARTQNAWVLSLADPPRRRVTPQPVQEQP